MKKKGKAVVVTTAHRGVFFGYLKKELGNTVTLTDAKNCISWTASVRGFIGLATTGPKVGCRIGPAADELKLHDVTSVITATKDAEKAWSKEIW